MELIELIVRLLDEKKASNLKVIDMRNSDNIVDFFVISSVNSDTQAIALAGALAKTLKENDHPYHHSEGIHGDRRWILVDVESVVVHLFVNEEREKYNLDKLWSDQAEVDIEKWLS